MHVVQLLGSLFAAPVSKNRELLREEFGLGGGGGGAGVAGGAAGDTDDAEDFHFGEGGAGDEHAEVVAVEVGRGELNAGVEHVEQVVGDDAFHDVVVAEAEADPEAVELGSAEEGFALGEEVTGEFADEVDGFDGVESEGAVLAVGGEQVDRFRAAERGRIQIAADGSAVEQEYDDLFVGRGGGGGAGFGGLCHA